MKRFPFTKVIGFLKQLEHKFDRINWGGCAVSASILAQHLAPHVDELKIVCYDGWRGLDRSIDKARREVNANTVSEWNSAGIAFTHVWVEFKWNNRWYTIDSEGLQSRKKMYKAWGRPFKGSFTQKEMKELAGTPRGWNSMFDRVQIPHMRKFAKKHLGAMLQAA